MRKLFTFFALVLFTSSVSYSVTKKPSDDIEAFTKDKKKVILHSSGKWEYAKEEEKVVKTVQGASSTKPDSSKNNITGKKVPYELWYDSSKWILLPKPLNEISEYSLRHANGDAYAMVISERISTTVDNLAKIVLENAQALSENAHITRSEKRVVNGLDVMFIEIRGTIQGIDFVYNYHLYTDSNGTLQVAVFTSESLYDEYKKDFEDILNGLTMIPKK